MLGGGAARSGLVTKGDAPDMDKPLIAVFGGNRIDAFGTLQAEALGQALVDAGYRIACGGMGGVMAAVACGARASSSWTGAEVLGIMPGWTDDELPNPWIDIELSTGMGSLRNTLIARIADAAIAIGGGSGTLSEIALAWHERRPLACLATSGGWAERLAGERLDERRERAIVSLTGVEDALAWLNQLFPRGVWPGRGPTRWWFEQIPCLHRVHEGEPGGARAIQAQLGMSLSVGDVSSRLHGLAQKVRAFNCAHGQVRRALVSLDDGHAEIMRLVPVFAGLPELQPVLFVTAALLDGDCRPLPLTAFYSWCASKGNGLDAAVERGIDRMALKRMSETAQREWLASEGIPLEPASERMLSRAQLELLRDAGWWIASHGPEHYDLREHDTEKLAERLVSVRRALLAFGGTPWLAWPEGRCTQSMVACARAAGFARQFGLVGERGCQADAELILRTLWI